MDTEINNAICAFAGKTAGCPVAAFTYSSFSNPPIGWFNGIVSAPTVDGTLVTADGTPAMMLALPLTSDGVMTMGSTNVGDMGAAMLEIYTEQFRLYNRYLIRNVSQ